jgi:hypothetical protein
MIEPLDYSTIYNEKIRPEINRRLKRLFFSFFGCIFLLYVASVFINFLNWPDKLIFLLFFPCATYYLHEIFSFKEIKCPHCKSPLFSLVNIGNIPLLPKTHVGKYCSHCGVKLR